MPPWPCGTCKQLYCSKCRALSALRNVCSHGGAHSYVDPMKKLEVLPPTPAFDLGSKHRSKSTLGLEENGVLKQVLVASNGSCARCLKSGVVVAVCTDCGYWYV